MPINKREVVVGNVRVGLVVAVQVMVVVGKQEVVAPTSGVGV